MRLLSVLVAAALCAPALVRAQTAPTISTQPASKSVNVGAAVTFTVVASGSSPAYQWMYNGAAISGATASSYAIASVQPAQAGAYTVVVSNPAGSVTSNPANLLVYAPYVVRTIAGTAGSSGYADAAGTAALFNHPQGIAVDGSGNVYVADSANDVIRRIDPSGNVTTLAGQAGSPGTANGPSGSARFYNPTGIAVDASGNVYVADCFNSTIREVAPGGTVSTLAGVAPTSAAPAPINQGSANGTGAAAHFNEPRGLALDGQGDLWIADTYNNTVRKLVLSTLAVTTFAGAAGNTAESLDGTGSSARFDYPFAIASDATGDLWVADTSGQTLRAVTPAQAVTTYAGTAGAAGNAGGTGSAARFNQPTGIAVDPQGDLFVADMGNDVIREVLPGGVSVVIAGAPGNLGTLDGAGAAARFGNPFAVAVDAHGNVFVADTGNDTIRELSPEPATDVPAQITTQPANQTVDTGQTATLSVVATGTPAPTYQWELNGAAISGATGASLVLSDVQPANAGSYSVVVSNEAATVVSNPVTLTVLSQPAVAAAAQDQTVAAGQNATFAVTATGGGLTYQWYLNGLALPNSNAPSFALSPAGTNAAGTYSVKVSNAVGSATMTVGTLAVTASARLANLSARGAVGSTSANFLVVGFVTSGAPKQILLRGAGPTLATFGVTGVLPSPVLTLYSSAGAALAANAGWNDSAALAAVFNQVGAFAFEPGSADSALAENLAPASYTAQVSGAGGATGVALAEIYDADTGTPAGRLINLSARANSGTGADVLTGGFVISGSTDETVLLRGVGPTLGAAPYNVPGAMAKPVLTLYNSSGTQLASNSGWGGSPILAALFTELGAFSLPAASADAALVETLAPGQYTVEVAGSGGTTGVALVEIYEVPPSP